MPRFVFVGLDDDQEDPIGVKELSYFKRSAPVDLHTKVAGTLHTQLNPYFPSTVRVRNLNADWAQGQTLWVRTPQVLQFPGDFAVWTARPHSSLKPLNPARHHENVKDIPEQAAGDGDGDGVPTHLYGLLQLCDGRG